MHLSIPVIISESIIFILTVAQVNSLSGKYSFTEKKKHHKQQKSEEIISTSSNETHITEFWPLWGCCCGQKKEPVVLLRNQSPAKSSTEFLGTSTSTADTPKFGCLPWSIVVENAKDQEDFFRQLNEVSFEEIKSKVVNYIPILMESNRNYYDPTLGIQNLFSSDLFRTTCCCQQWWPFWPNKDSIEFPNVVNSQEQLAQERTDSSQSQVKISPDYDEFKLEDSLFLKMREIVYQLITQTMLKQNLSTTQELIGYIPCWYHWWPWLFAYVQNIMTYKDMEQAILNSSLQQIADIVSLTPKGQNQPKPNLFIDFLMPWTVPCRQNLWPLGPQPLADQLSYDMDDKQFNYIITSIYNLVGTTLDNNYSEFNPFYKVCWYRENWPYVLAFVNNLNTFQDMRNYILGQTTRSIQNELNKFMNLWGLHLQEQYDIGKSFTPLQWWTYCGCCRGCGGCQLTLWDNPYIRV